jgi:hypothetical protein
LEKTETSNKEIDCSWLDYQNSWWGNLFCVNNLLHFFNYRLLSVGLWRCWSLLQCAKWTTWQPPLFF